MLYVFCTFDDFVDAEELWLTIKREQIQISRASVYRMVRWLTLQGFTLQKRDEVNKKQLYQPNLPC